MLNTKAHLAKIEVAGVAAAYYLLLERLPRHALIPSTADSAILGVRLHDAQGRYLFAWIVNPRHLLFYIRKPALTLAPCLADAAFDDWRGVHANPAGETTIRLERSEDALALLEWLEPVLPLG